MGPEAWAHAWDPRGARGQSHAWWAPTAWQSVWLKVSPHAWPEKAQLARQGARADLVSSPLSLPWGCAFLWGRCWGAWPQGTSFQSYLPSGPLKGASGCLAQGIIWDYGS